MALAGCRVKESICTLAVSPWGGTSLVAKGKMQTAFSPPRSSGRLPTRPNRVTRFTAIKYHRKSKLHQKILKLYSIKSKHEHTQLAPEIRYTELEVYDFTLDT